MHHKTSFALRAVALLAAFLFSFSAGAQQKGGPAGTNPNEFKIVKLSDLKHDSRQKLRAMSGTSAKAKEWGVFDVTFATAPEWIDGLVATFTVVLDNPKADEKKGERRISIFQTSAEYPDVAKGNDHKVGVVLPPTAFLRYGDPIGFAVQFTVGGQEIAAQGQGDGLLKGRDAWWGDSRILDAPIVQRREGYLFDRMKSPFQLVDIDSYEVSR
jgi:hypothetical protein